MADKRTSVAKLTHYLWSMSGCDAAGEYFEIDGEVYAINVSVIMRNLDWMAEHDYNKATVLSTEIVEAGTPARENEDGIAIFFSVGPYPSYIKSNGKNESFSMPAFSRKPKTSIYKTAPKTSIFDGTEYFDKAVLDYTRKGESEMFSRKVTGT